MKIKTITNNIMYFLFCGFSGVTIATIVWIFLKAMNIGIEFIWLVVPKTLNFKFYPLIICTLGGLMIGVYQKLTSAIPEELDTIMLKVKQNKFYPYNNTLLLIISAILPLIFGGSIGPEAGLAGVIVGLCYWAQNYMKNAKNKIPNLLEIGISATLGTVFYAPLFALVAPVEEKYDNNKQNVNINISKIASNTIAVLFSIGTLFFLNSIFGGSTGLPKINSYVITNTERLWGIPLAIIGVFAGLIFIIFEKTTSVFFEKIQCKLGIIISATLGGILLGLIGVYMPLVMFSGEKGILELQSNNMKYSWWLLVLIGVLKLFITNVCIKSGWKGGHFFPVIFCGISIGYGIAILSGLDIAFCAAIITAGLLGVTIKKPIAVTVLMLLCFDIKIVPWILLSAFIGSIIPLKKKKKSCL